MTRAIGNHTIKTPTPLVNLHTALLTARGLLTVPGGIVLAIWFGAAVTLALDAYTSFSDDRIPLIGVPLPFETMTAVLGTIAGAAITTLSLVYSLVLVVFTLAAGTIAPRLLKRFTNDRVSQVTAGLLGGTFLFSLTVLVATRPDFLPVLSGTAAFLLAALSVLQLIYFVHEVSVSVMIDEEIAELGKTLSRKMAEIVREDAAADDAGTSMSDDFDHTIDSLKTGFLSAIDAKALVAYAEKHDLTIDLRAAPGDFIAEGENLARIAGDGGKSEKMAEDIRACLVFTAAREDLDDIVFSLNLMLEIALRALSPGINDTFTAISCTNHLSRALTAPAAKGIRENIHLDNNDVPRLRIPGLTLEDLLDKTIRPIRQCAAGNALMLSSLAGMIRRLYALGYDDRVRRLLEDHARDLLAGYEATGPLSRDLEALRHNLAPVLARRED